MGVLVRSVTIPTAYEGLTFFGENYYGFTSGTPNALATLNRNGTLVRGAAFTDPLTKRGLTHDKRVLYYISNTGVAGVHSITRLDRGGIIQARAITGITQTHLGLTYDGDRFYVSDIRTTIQPSVGSIRVYDGSLTLVNSLSVISVTGKLCTDRKELYLVTENTQSDASSKNPTSEGTNSWTNASDGRTTDNVCATAGSGTVTGFWTGYGFAIPTTAIITDIQVDVKWAHSTQTTRLLGVNVGKSEATLGTAQDQTAGVEGACSDSTVKSSFGLWGLTWTPEEINASGFTVRLQTPASGSGTWRVDSILVTVSYDEGTTIQKMSKSGTIIDTTTFPGRTGIGDITFDGKLFAVIDSAGPTLDHFSWS